MAASISFTEFPEDVQLCILSFLSPSEISTFSCTSKRFVSLCRNDVKLWFTMCDRRWGTKTQIRKWANGRISYRVLYRTLNEWENLIGFWRRSGEAKIGVTSPPLVFFEWGPTCLTGSRVSPAKNGTYGVIKAPFLWMSLSPEGQAVNFLDPEGRTELSSRFGSSVELDLVDSYLVPVNVSFIGKTHVVVEENVSLGCNSQRNGLRRSSSSTNLIGDDGGFGKDMIGAESGSPGSLPDRLMSEIYQYFANRTSPGADRASRRQRRREKERQGRRKWEPEHFVKIVNCSPSPSRPLQGLWKGPSDDTNLEFYLVAYDDIGGIACRRVGDSLSDRFSDYAPVFWTPNATFIECPLTPEEEYLYDSRIHLRPFAEEDHIHGQLPSTETEVVCRLLHINSSYDLVIPDLVGTSTNPRLVEGRIWQYRNGTFGFGFLRDNYIIDLKHIAQDGCLFDSVDLCSELVID